MNVVDAIAHAMKAEGIDMLFAYPVNPLIEAAAKLDIRTVIVRQERIGLTWLTPARASRRATRSGFLHAAWAGRRKRLWRRGSGLFRISTDFGDSRRLSAAACSLLSEFQFHAQYAAHHQVG